MSLYQFAKSSITYLKDNFGTFPDKGFIAGGSLANLIWEQKSGNVAKINDIDIFIYKGEYKREYEKSTSLWDNDKGEKLNYLSTQKNLIIDYNGITTTRTAKDYYKIISSKRNGIFNLIEYQASSERPDLVLESFDMNCVRVGYSIEEDKFYWDSEFEEFIETGNLKLSNILTPAHSAIRLVKKKVELNCNISLFELELCKLALSKNYGDINKLYFTDKYGKIFDEYQNILNKHFEKKKSDEITNIFSNNENLPNLDIYQLIPKGIISEKLIKYQEKIDSIYWVDTLMFFIREIMEDDYKTFIWENLTPLFDSKDYIDGKISKDKILFLKRLIKFAPNSIENLKGLKLTEQINLLDFFFEKFSHDPIIAMSILEMKKLNKKEFDEGDLLLLELSVRKHIINEDKRIDKILEDKVEAEDNYGWLGF